MKEVCCTALLFLLAATCAAQSGGYQGIKEKLPLEVAPQPVPFSHKQHVSAGLSCKDCHTGADEKARAGLPDAEQCMLCHRTIKTDSPAIEKLAEIHATGKTIDWVRVYRVPDFVFFNHANHVVAGVECSTCHGPIEKRDVLAKEVSTSMIQCMNCHREREASVSCHLCHELGQ